jgi:hypothetical protein
MAVDRVRLADLTPDRLRGVSRARSLAPRGPTFTARLTLRPGAAPEGEAGQLDVAIDCAHLDEDLAALVAIIRAAVRAEA